MQVLLLRFLSAIVQVNVPGGVCAKALPLFAAKLMVISTRLVPEKSCSVMIWPLALTVPTPLATVVPSQQNL